MAVLDTQIVAVSVYPDRARVTRAGTAQLEAGTQELVVQPLPQRMDAASLRVTGKGAARLQGVRASYERQAQAAPGDAQAAQARLQELLDQDRILADEQEAWQIRLGVVKNIGAAGGESFARNLARGKLSLESLTVMLDYFSQSQEAGADTLRDLTVRRRELEKQIAAARAEADKLASGAGVEYYAAHLQLDAPTAGAAEFQISYVVYDASWQPMYDARLEGQTLEWNYLAQVRQQTGEAWATPYALNLSTATLATGLDKPELPPWHIDEWRQPVFRQMKARGPAEMAVANAPAPAMMADAMPAMAYAEAVVESSGPSVTYQIPSPRTVPSDGEPQQLVITAQSIPAQLDYFAAPKVDAHAFVRARFTNPGEHVMLPGEVTLFHGADLVGTRHLDAIPPRQEVELFLGAEERISIERRETERAVDKNLLGNTARATFGYRIRIENPSLDRVRLTVLDQIPVSQHPDIKVKLRDANPKPARQTEQGELAWELDLPEGSRTDLTFSFVVEYPKELRVAGL